MVILEETLAPPKMAKTGFLPESIILSILSISLAKSNPKHLVFGKNFVMTVVDACAL